MDELKAHFHHSNPMIKDKEVYDQLIDRVQNLDVSDSLTEDIVRKYIEQDFANKITNKLIPILSSQKFGVLPSIRKELDEYDEVIQLRDVVVSPFVDADLSDLLHTEVTSTGLNWRLGCLNQNIGPLRGGSLGHVYARPDTGKTSFLLSETSAIAGQLEGDEHILWFNNEERGGKVKLRLYSAVLGASIQTIMANVDAAKATFDARGGNRIKLFDSAFITDHLIKKYLKEFKTRVVIIDQGDKVAFPGEGDLSQTDRLQKLYQRFREIAKEYGVDIITAGQASAEAEGKKWLQLDHMNNSKTGKPGELDYAIALGCTPDSMANGVRYLTVTKNKCNQGEHGRHTVLIDTQKARYRDAV